MENTEQAREELRSFYKFVLHMIEIQTIIADKRKDSVSLQQYNQSLEMAKKIAELLLETIDFIKELNN